MARFRDAEQILTAADHWKQKCLLGEGSLFTKRQLWTRTNLEELKTRYVDKLDDTSSDSFLVKLERQLANASDDAKCLWAEMAWVYHLIQHRQAFAPASKRERVFEVWSWSGHDLPQDHELLHDVVLGSGVVKTGTAYNTLSWMEFRFFVVAMREWYSLDANERESLINRAWDFASWLDETEFAKNRMLRHAILFLIFPDEFEPIVSNQNKRLIISRLHRGDRLNASKPMEIDRALLTIRQRLENEYPGEVHFHISPIKELWKSKIASSKRDRTRPTRPKPQKEGLKVRESGSYGPEDAHRGLFISRADFDRVLESIRQRKNLILQGPPGTGKTFIARRIAWCLIGRKDSRLIEMVQFHQSYAYEDFVEGFRPVKEGGFELKKGIFPRFCEQARDDPNTPHVFIIDEINRGNLSRIFGELLMLIEKDKRSEDYSVTLAYSDKQFHVPANVYILGMMNTADRSLALVDYALRRRFAFETLEPAYATAFGKTEFEKNLTDKGANRSLSRRISERMGKLNEKIRDDSELGRGFQIGHSYFVPHTGDEPTEEWYKHIVHTQIAPLLREYWFDSPEDIEREVAKLTAPA